MMKQFLAVLAVTLMMGCWADTAPAQCGGGYGGGYYSARPAISVSVAPRSYGYGGYGGYGYSNVRSSYYRGPSRSYGYGGGYGGYRGYGSRSPYGFNYGARSIYSSPGFYRGGYGGGRGISIGIGF